MVLLCVEDFQNLSEKSEEEYAQANKDTEGKGN